MYQVASVTGKVIPWEIDPIYFKTRCRFQLKFQMYQFVNETPIFFIQWSVH